MKPAGAAFGIRQRLADIFGATPREIPAVLAAGAMFFLLFTGYFMLRPVRETMGIAGGVDNLQWLFTATFVAALVALPVFGWIASTVARRRILPWTFALFVANLLIFAAIFANDPDNVWSARAFYVWLSVFNLLAISLAWSVMADLFTAEQAKRLFALIAAGATAGGLAGPLLGTLLVGPIGHAGLMVISAVLLIGSALAARVIQRWRDSEPLEPDAVHSPLRRSEPLGGNPFAGASEVASSKYLLAISLFVVLLASVSTFLYFEQARLVAETFPDRTRQTQVFGTIDVAVQTLTILIQLFLTGRIARSFGVRALLTVVPALMALGFLLLAAAPVFALFVGVMVLRRVGEYALVRPGREMLFTVVPPTEKYKAKTFIDTVVYRGADALSGWLKRALDVLGDHPALTMMIGAIIAVIWAMTGWTLARLSRELEPPPRTLVEQLTLSS